MIKSSYFCIHKEHIYQDIIKKICASGIFIKEFIKSPGSVGSICPSSTELASSLINAVPDNNDNGLIVDLGAGSGVVTEQLIKTGVSPKSIIAVEKSSGFIRIFNKRCPGIPLIISDACSLENILFQYKPECRIKAIISSLPLRSLQSHVVTRIMREILRVLRMRGGIFIQYTYALWKRCSLQQYGFKPFSAHIVYGNLPPAKVESYTI